MPQNKNMMDIKSILEYGKHSVSMHRLELLESFIGGRFSSVVSIMEKIPEPSTIIHSEDEDAFDNVLDGEFSDGMHFMLFYLLDNQGQIYITEISLSV